jgi:light-regulated signal transduction histidine kinase (bacteriophytochrome)
MAIAEQKLANAIKVDSTYSFIHVKTAMEEVSRILDNSLKMQRIKAVSPPSGEKLEEVDVNDLLMSIIYMRQSEFDTNGVSLDIPSNLPIVRYPQADLTQVFNNLVSQSIKFTEGAASSKISITTSNESNCYNIYVKSRPVMDKIDTAAFLDEDFSNGKPKGTVTMALARDIIKKFNGKIWIDQKGDEVSICFTIPKF